MRRIFYVDQSMCGGDELPGDFDLEEFCEVLQNKVPEVEIVALPEPDERAVNLDPSLVSASVFDEALGEYYHR